MPQTRAIVRPPGANLALGLTTSTLGPPDIAVALDQHERYCRALETCGLALDRLPPDENHPDSTFVEDTAVVTPRGALIARPGAASRRGETAGVRAALSAYHPVLGEICAPGTLDGGDVLEAAGHYFIGLSTRTNKEGAGQLADWLADLGFSSTIVDVHGLRGLLHLKSGFAYLGGRRLAIVDSLCGFDEFSEWDLIRVPAGEEYAANCLRINERVLVAAGFPAFEAALREIELNVVTLDVSEFRKMDGGLSCLSIRF